jgi:hypothetical protein
MWIVLSETGNPKTGYVLVFDLLTHKWAAASTHPTVSSKPWLGATPLMGRPMSPEREKEFEELLAFLDFYFENIKRPTLPASIRNLPMLRAEAERIAREHGRSRASVGTRQAVNDVVEDLSHLTPESLELLDQALREAGVLTLSEVRRRYSALYQRILRRGKIKTDTEYYLVNGLVVDQTSALTSDERDRLQGMISAYEG